MGDFVVWLWSSSSDALVSLASTSSGVRKVKSCSIRNDVLPVLAKRDRVVDDQRRGHQVLFLHFVVRMHPVRAGNGRVVVSLRGAVPDGWGLRPGKAVLLPGWKLPVPVNNGGRAGFIGEFDPEPFTWSKAKARTPRQDR